jgi:hypothetical protein
MQHQCSSQGLQSSLLLIVATIRSSHTRAQNEVKERTGRGYKGNVKPGGGELCSGGIIINVLHGAKLLLCKVKPVNLNEH